MRARTRVLWIVALGAGVLSADCSLLGLDHLNLPHCTANSDCDPLNAAHGIGTDACMRYQCQMSSGACVLGARDTDGDLDPAIMCGGTDCDDNNPARAGAGILHERCDGIDNDCNGVIDETSIRPRDGASAVTGLSGLTEAAYSAAPMGTAGISFVLGAQPGLNVLQGPSASPATPQSTAYASQLAEDPANVLLQPMLHSGCEVAAPGRTPPVMPGDCNVADIAVAPADSMNDWFVAAINTMGCNDGQLRIGFAGTVEASLGAPYPDIILRGPPARSNVYLGVDVAASDRYCTGQSQTTHGAARPSVGSLLAHGAAPQGLVTFLGATITRGMCGGPTSPVEAIGVWLASGSSGGQTIHWVTGTNTGTPQVLGMSNGGARPAIASWTGASAPGWFVGYGSATGRVEMRFVAGLGVAPAVDMTTGHEYTPGVSSPLTIDTAATIPNGAGGPADDVAMAVGHGDGSSTDVGVTWIEACSATPALYFARAHYVSGSPGQWTIGMPMQVSATPTAGSPSIAYVSDGFVLPGFARNGATATVGSTGGWLIAWVNSDGHVLARRIAEFDAQLIDEPEIDLTAATAHNPRLPFVYPDDASRPLLLRYAYIDGAGSATGGDLLCGNGASIGP